MPIDYLYDESEQLLSRYGSFATTHNRYDFGLNRRPPISSSGIGNE
ncbi:MULTISPECIES: hypothetical protein [Brevibacillus]|jgi:hypothetical protein|nr:MULTISPECIES: hypothetical protein [Brevibacillus]